MARGFNSVQLIGTVTQQPELRYSAGGLAILDIQLAGSDSIIDDDGKPRDIAWYHRVTVFAKQAEILADILDIGMPVFAEARLNYNSWEDKISGQRKSSLNLKALRVQALTEGTRSDDAVLTDARGQPRLKNALNNVLVIGNLTKDAELRYTPNGHAVTRLSLAVNESYKDRSGNDQENVHFVDAQVWRSLAEACGELKKGAPVLIAGRFVTDSWDDKDGNKRYQNRIEGSRVEFLARGSGGQSESSQTTTKPAPPPSARQLDIDEEFPPEDDLPF